MNSRLSDSRWKAISCSMSRSRALQANGISKRRRRRHGCGAISCPLFDGAQHARDGARQTYPALPLGLGCGSALSRERVVFGLAVVVADAPRRRDEAAPLHPVEGGVERTFLDSEHIVGELVD